MAKYTGAAQLASVVRAEPAEQYTAKRKSRLIFQPDPEAAEIIAEQEGEHFREIR